MVTSNSTDLYLCSGTFRAQENISLHTRKLFLKEAEAENNNMLENGWNH